MARMDIFTIKCLLFGFTMIVSANDCRVREKYSPELWNGNPLKILAFTSEKYGFTCMLNFQRLDEYLFHDKIVLTPSGNRVVRMDDGNRENLNIHSTLNATGWNELTFSIDDKSTFMVTVRDKLILNYTVKYPVKTINTYGSNISLCSSPSWAVGENEASVIPLYTRLQDNDGDKVYPKNSSIYLTLTSTASFNPIINVDGKKRFLTMKNGEILLSQDLFQPLRLKKYLLEVHTQNQKVNINCKLGNDSKKLLEFQVTTVLSDIEISSQRMSFTVNLDLSSILFTTTTATTTTTKPLNLAVATNDDSSTALVIGIVITILVLLALVVIIIFYMKHKRSSFQEQKQHYDGDNRSSIPEIVSLIGSKNEISFNDENNESKITPARQSDLKDTSTCDDSAENMEQESETLPPNELQSTIGSSTGNNILRDHRSPIDQRSSTLGADHLQGPIPHEAKLPHVAPPHTAPPHVNPISSPPNSTPRQAAIQAHTYLSSSHSESRIDVPPEMSQEEIDKRINLNNSVYNSAIDQSKKHIASGEYANAREALTNAIIMINQSKVGNDSRCMTIIGILQDNHSNINSKIDNIFNPDKTQHPHIPTSKADTLDQPSLYESRSAGYQLQAKSPLAMVHSVSRPSGYDAGPSETKIIDIAKSPKSLQEAGVGELSSLSPVYEKTPKKQATVSDIAKSPKALQEAGVGGLSHPSTGSAESMKQILEIPLTRRGGLPKLQDRINTIKYQHAVAFSGQKLLHLVMKTLICGDINNIIGCVRETLRTNTQFNNSFTKEEQEILATVHHEKWDVSLLFKVVQKVCGLEKAGDSCWTKHNGGEECLEYLITMLKDQRNKVLQDFLLLINEVELEDRLNDLTNLALNVTSTLGVRAPLLGKQLPGDEPYKTLQLVFDIIDDAKGTPQQNLHQSQSLNHGIIKVMKKMPLESDSLQSEDEIEKLTRKMWEYAGPQDVVV